MKIFNKNETWTEKVNFVDENNVVLGYDLSQSCCEHADWFIAEYPRTDIPKETEETKKSKSESEIDMPGWYFDKLYFQKLDNDRIFDAGGIAVFRITDGKSEKFIHLFNCHNGYYSHGFTFSSNDEQISNGYL